MPKKEGVLEWISLTTIEPQLSDEAARRLGNDRDVRVPSFIVLQATKSGA